jgi:hypothetical protein
MDIIPKWIYDPNAGKVEDLDPQRSWDRDPDIKPVPTADDAFEAARYKRQFGDSSLQAIDIGDPYGVDRPYAWSRRFGAKSRKPETSLDPVEQRGVRINPQETDYLRIGQLQANQMPQSYGRFDPRKTTITRDKDEFGAAGISYSPTQQVWLDPKEEQSTGHELGHLGYHDIYNNDPEAKRLMLEMDKKFVN